VGVRTAVVFVDGQNVMYSFGRTFHVRRLDFDLPGVVKAVCAAQGWTVRGINFYTGLPRRDIDQELHDYWMRRLSHLGRVGVHPWKRRLAYSTRTTRCPECGHEHTRTVAREKGVDARICLDAVAAAARGEMDVALFFTQDQDFFEAAQEIRRIGRHQGREIVVASAFPRNGRNGIRDTLQLPISPEDFEPYRRI
jgi:uncharacterized LabA/DUF88 family protein